MVLHAGCQINVSTIADTPLVLILQPQTGAAQVVLDSTLTIMPWVPYRHFTDSFGNSQHRLMLGAGQFTILSTCNVDAHDVIDVEESASYTPIQDVADDALMYLLPSRYCQSDLMGDLATQVTRGASPGYGQVEIIRDWIEKKFRYKYGVSTASTSAVETAKKKKGVCRDFSHVGIALCRAIGIPARIVFGYLYELNPMDLHVWFEAYVGGRWYTFDATQKTPRGNRIVIAYGRDAADVAQMSQYGPLTVDYQQVWVRPA